MISVFIGVASAALIISLITLPISILSLAYIVGVMKSTHQVQFIPAETELSNQKDWAEANSTSFDDSDMRHI